MHHDLASNSPGRATPAARMPRAERPGPRVPARTPERAPQAERESTAPARPSLNLSEDEVREATGGYRVAAFQLAELHRRGFVRAYRSKVNGTVVLERAHYEAVTRGFFGLLTAVNEPLERKRPTPDRAGFMARFGKNKKEA